MRGDATSHTHTMKKEKREKSQRAQRHQQRVHTEVNNT